MDMQAFYAGMEFNAHDYLGAHATGDGMVFRTFAPNAAAVSLLKNGRELPMQRIYDGNFYELIVPEAAMGETYEYRIHFQNGGYQDHCDPYGFQMEKGPNHKSVLCDLSDYVFGDHQWMRERTDCVDKPLNIYEMHLGSWRRGNGDRLLSYVEIAHALIRYLQQSGYNYVELMPISEHPCDESWGYQNTGFYAPTSRYGRPQELMQMIDLLHQNEIGVILDFVPVHFAVDAYALAQYDGTALYEYPHNDVGVSEWGSYNFMHSRGEVRSFLQSAANHWLTHYHFDGLRMDAISRILYWQGDEKRGENKNGMDFLKRMNRGLKERHRGCMVIAEDSTHYPGITQPVDKGGLSFDYKWDMGWMHDTLAFFQLPPALRSRHYHKLTFSMMYFYDERFLLPYSHDEVVHGKATIVQKMNGPYEEKFPQARAMYLYMLVHPGKKLNFMGNEFGQLREWDEKREQDWGLRQYPIHDGFYQFLCALNRLYLSHSALFEMDDKPSGFSWVDCHQEEKCIYVISRRSQTEELIAVFNLGDRAQSYALPAPYDTKTYEMLLNTQWEPYGGRQPVAREAVCPLALERFSGMLLAVKEP